jgi:hypothetical protein
MTTSRVFDTVVFNRGFKWRVVGAVWPDGTIDLIEVYYVNPVHGEARVGADNLACMKMDELLVKRIKETVKCSS